MILVRHPEHAGFNRTIFDTGRRARTTGAAVGGDRQNAWPLLARGLSVADGHRPVFIYDVECVLFFEGRHVANINTDISPGSITKLHLGLERKRPACHPRERALRATGTVALQSKRIASVPLAIRARGR